MPNTRPTRRAFLGSTAVAVAAAPAAFSRPATAQPTGEDIFVYEVTRTEDEWRAMLTDEEFRIMREMGTEPRFTSDLWDEERDGVYACKGCDLPIYDNTYKEVLFIGWLFFDHSFPATVLTNIDILPAEYGGADDMGTAPALMEAHCRRCGSHLGHILTVQDKTRHCINGTSLTFTPAEA